MKISLSILTLIVLLFGCGSVPEEKPAEEAAKQPEQESKQETAKPVEKKQEQKQEIIVEQTIFLLAEESSFFGDGSLFKVKKLSYSEDSNNLEKLETFTASGDLIEFTVYEYDGGMQIKRSTYSGAKELRSYHLSEYADDGNSISKDILYDSGDKVQTTSAFEYDGDGNRTKWSISDGGGALLGYSTYSYSDGKRVRTDIFDMTGKLEEFGTLEYNANGKMISERFFTASGKPLRYSELDYRHDKLVAESHFSDSKKLERKLNHEHDDAGNVIKTTQLDRGLSVKQITEMDYISRTEYIKR